MYPFGFNSNPLVQMLSLAKGKSAKSIVDTIVKQNPAMKQTWDKAQQMAGNMNAGELESTVRKMAKEQGIDIDEISRIL